MRNVPFGMRCTSRIVTRLVAGLTACLGTGLLACNSDPSGPAADFRPSFVLVMTDDQALDDIEYMPQVQTLARNGIRFTNAFATSPVCSPSRASLLTGRYAHNHGVRTNVSPTGGFGGFRDSGAEQSTVAVWLKEAGYRTAHFGKYLNGYGQAAYHSDWSYVPPGWSEWRGLLSGWGPGSRFFDFQLNEDGRLVPYIGQEEYEADVLAHQLSEFIIRAAKDGEPFAAFVSTFAPHKPATPAPRHENTLGGVKAPRRPSFNESDVSDKPAARQLRLLTASEIDEIDALYQLRLESVQAVDEMLVRVMATLDSLGAGHGTYVIYMSDHGFHLGEHRAPPGKGLPYEEDLRIPLVIAGPGVAPGVEVADMVLNIDLAPTLAKLAGARTPATVDGRSFATALGGGAARTRQSFLVENWQPQATQAAGPTFDAVRTAEALYVEWGDGAIELYDLNNDPFQLDNLSQLVGPEVISAFAAHLGRLRSCAAAGCRHVENSPAPSLTD